MFTISFVNLDLALRLVKLVTLKEHMSGEGPNFTNHAGTQGLNDVRRSHGQRVLSQIINTSPNTSYINANLEQFSTLLFRSMVINKLSLKEGFFSGICVVKNLKQLE